MQNKLQREQLDNFSGYQTLVNVAFGSQAMGTPHGGNQRLPQELVDVYSISKGRYPLESENPHPPLGYRPLGHSSEPRLNLVDASFSQKTSHCL